MSREFPDVDYLGHIRDAIEKIQRYTSGTGEAEFLRNEIIQDAVIRNLEVVGEAVTKLSSELKANYPEVPWLEVSGMRNRLIHGDMSVNLTIVWDTVDKVLPGFLATVNAIVTNLQNAERER